MTPFPDWKTHGTPDPNPKGFGAAAASPAPSDVAAPSSRQRSAAPRTATNAWVLHMTILLARAARVGRSAVAGLAGARRRELRRRERSVRERADPAPGLDHEAPAARPARVAGRR